MENFAHQYPSPLYQYGHPIFRSLSNYRQSKEIENQGIGLWSRRAAASARWSSAGWPSRSDEEVEAILAICKTCENYNNAGCNLCGCRVNRKRAALFNKARMATERCPVGLW